MSVIREHKTTADRSASDRKRHRQKIEEAIKEGVYHVVADESIIGQDGKKKFKIPVKGIKEYQFIFGDNKSNKQVMSAPGADVKKGQVIGRDEEAQGQGFKAGNEEGEELYEVEITLDDLASYLFDDLDLPDLDKKKMKQILENRIKRKGHRNQGIRPRLDKRGTLRNRIKRKLLAQRISQTEVDEIEETPADSDEAFPFHERDLRYRHIAPKPKEVSSAAVFLVMDVSGSMSTEKRYLSRSFFFLLCQFLRYKYDKIEIVFVAHDTIAKEVAEDQFFSRVESGGTLISPAINLVREIAEKRYHPDSWNIYTFHCSDGDNWSEDVEKAVLSSTELKKLCQLYCYCEVIPTAEEVAWNKPTDVTPTMAAYQPHFDKKFKWVKLNEKTDIWPSFKKLFGAFDE